MNFDQSLLVFLAAGAALMSLWARSWAMRFVSEQRSSSEPMS